LTAGVLMADQTNAGETRPWAVTAGKRNVWCGGGGRTSRYLGGDDLPIWKHDQPIIAGTSRSWLRCWKPQPALGLRCWWWSYSSGCKGWCAGNAGGSAWGGGCGCLRSRSWKEEWEQRLYRHGSFVPFSKKTQNQSRIYSCKVSIRFWQNVLAWLRDNVIQISSLEERDLKFRKFEITEAFKVINHMLLLGKFCLLIAIDVM